jgi:hypothetical protein
MMLIDLIADIFFGFDYCLQTSYRSFCAVAIAWYYATKDW